MKRALILLSVLTLLSVSALGCQRKADDDKATMEKNNDRMMESGTQSATQKATVEIIDSESMEKKDDAMMEDGESMEKEDDAMMEDGESMEKEDDAMMKEGESMEKESMEK